MRTKPKGLNAKKPDSTTCQASLLISAPQEQTEMTSQANSINQRRNIGIIDHKQQAQAMPFVEDFDEDFFATLAERLGAESVNDCPPGGFFVYGQRVCNHRQRGQFVPTSMAPEGFNRWRLAGADGVPRFGDHKAPAVIYSRAGDAFMMTRRDNLKPKTLTFSQLVELLNKHARGERV